MAEVSEVGLAAGSDGQPRCWWGLSTPDYEIYHDVEWGRPVADEQPLFEKLCLEGFQSGLSWLTILRKRDAFREVFHDFAIDRVAEMDEGDVARLLGDARIIRHRGKIEATIGNARVAQEARDEFGSFGALLWSFEPVVEGPAPGHTGDVPATTPASTAMSRALKKRGFRFVGPTTAYALMQAMGMVNDHLAGCVVRTSCADARLAFHRPA